MAVDGFTDRLTRHFGYRSIRHDALTASSWIELRSDLCDADGQLLLGVLAYLVDSTAGVVCGMAAVPAWVITSDLQFRVVAAPTVGPLRADARAVQPGKRQSLGDVRVVDEGDADRLIAVGTVNHVVIQRDEGLDVPADMPIGVEYASGCDVTGHAPLLEHFQVRNDGSGTAELPIEGDAVNPLGVLHGGLISLLVEQAARDAARGKFAGRDHEVVDVVVRFMRGLKATPARATATLLQGDAERPSVVVEVRDASGALGALASTSLRPKGHRTTRARSHDKDD
jgi:acyl-coenzyme A thioesterase PaaI-like protein